ncbi:hypothetical protein ACFLUG_04280, partial [Chloroflexota bacterium]
NSLYSYLKVSQSNIVEISGFAQDYLEPSYRDGYRTHMTQKNLPEHAISKDLSYLTNKLRRRQIHFSSKVRIIAPADRFNEIVDIRGSENGRTIVSIEGNIERTE